MAYNEAKKISNKKSDAKYSQILLKPYKADAERIRQAAKDAGLSVQRFILTLVMAYINDDGGESSGK